MRVPAVPLLLLAPMLLAAGCTLVPDPQPQDVTGAVDGYDPTASHLKVHVLQGDRIILVDFDRRDWNVAGIVKMIDEKVLRNVTVHGMPREVLNEILVQTVGNPSELSKYRWTDQTSPEERSLADKAYDDLVAKAHPVSAVPVTPSAPPVALPTTAVP